MPPDFTPIFARTSERTRTVNRKGHRPINGRWYGLGIAYRTQPRPVPRKAWRADGLSSKRRLRAIACTGKVRHKTMLAARIAAKKTHGKVNPYKCGHCKFYHVGHTPAKRQHRRQNGHA